MFWNSNLLAHTRTHSTHTHPSSFTRAVETGACSCAERLKFTSVCHKENVQLWWDGAPLTLAVNILMNDAVSSGTPHLLECFSGYLALVLHVALCYYFHMSHEWPSPHSCSKTKIILTSKHADTWLLTVLIIYSREMIMDILRTSQNITLWKP